MSTLLKVEMKNPYTGDVKAYEVPETVLRTVVSWAGSTKETAALLQISPGAITSQLHNYPCMREMIAMRYMLSDHLATEGMQGAIAGRNEIMQFWTRQMYQAKKVSDQLSASVNLAKAHGMFVERIEQTNVEDTGVRKEVKDRLAQLLEHNANVAAYGDVLN